MVLLGIALRISIECKEESMFELSSSIKISPGFRMLAWSVGAFICLTSLGISEVDKELLLPQDFRPFNKEEFKQAFDSGEPWDMKALVHDIRLGDLSQRSIWAGTERHMDIKKRTRLFLGQQKIGENLPFSRNRDFSSEIRVDFNAAGGVVYGKDFKDVRYRDGGKVRLVENKYAGVLALNDNSMLHMIFPRHRRPKKQGAVLLCYRPFYSRLKIKKNASGKKTVQVMSDRRAFFGALTYTFKYSLSGRFITGSRVGRGDLKVFASPEFIEDVVDEDSHASINPYLELNDEKTEGINTVNYDGVTPLRSDITTSVRFEIPGGKSGTYLHHRIVEIIPANEEMSWARERILKVSDRDLPYEESAECVYYVSYRVEREIYGEGKGEVLGVE
jgi:hypothetical protein